MPLRLANLGELTCRILSRVPETKRPRLVVVLCHGFGAPGTDLVPLGEELVDLRPELAESVEFIFPAAPLSLEDIGLAGGRAWWHIDMEELVGAVERGELRILRERRPEGITAARDLLIALLDQRQRQTELPPSRFVLAGFSQGSMLAVETALNWSGPIGGLGLWSSTLVSEEEWRAKAARLKDVPVVQSHGRQDPILPFQAALLLRDLLIEAGANVDFLEFNGPHTIPYPALERFGNLLQRLLMESAK